MSEEEQKKGEGQNQEMSAVFWRLRASGLKWQAAVERTTEHFGLEFTTRESKP